jgi:hypothetical protein
LGLFLSEKKGLKCTVTLYGVLADQDHRTWHDAFEAFVVFISARQGKTYFHVEVSECQLFKRKKRR